MAKNRQFQTNEIIGVDPVLCCLPNESALISPSRGVALDGVATCSDEVIEFGELDDDSVVVVLVEGPLLEELLDESGFQGPVCSFL